MTHMMIVSHLKKRRQEVYQIATRTGTKGETQGKVLYDRKVQGRGLHPDDRVLHRNLTLRGGPGKIQFCWERKVYKVKERKADGSHVYEISPEKIKGRNRAFGAFQTNKNPTTITAVRAK